MSHEYSHPSRANDPRALPDAEVFYAEPGELEWCGQEEPNEAGYYYWYCFLGCLPDSDPCGPYDTYAEAFAAMRDDNDSEEGGTNE